MKTKALWVRIGACAPADTTLQHGGEFCVYRTIVRSNRRFCVNDVVGDEERVRERQVVHGIETFEQ